MPEFPQQIKKDIQEFTKQLLPHFFVFAKDKIKEQVREPNNTIVNKLFKHIPNPRLKFSYMNSEGKRKALGKPNYCLLMTNPDLELKIDKDKINNPIIKKYSELASKYGYKISVVTNDSEIGQFPREVLYKSQLKERALYGKIYKQVREEMANNGYEDWEVADILVKYLYDIKNSKNKDLLWICYGEYLYRNLEKNVKSPTKEVQCIDCGEWFEILKKDNETCRCANCYREYRRKYKTQKERERRMRMKLKGDMDSTKKS